MQAPLALWVKWWPCDLAVQGWRSAGRGLSSGEWSSIVLILSLSPSHCLDMTEVLFRSMSSIPGKAGPKSFYIIPHGMLDGPKITGIFFSCIYSMSFGLKHSYSRLAESFRRSQQLDDFDISKYWIPSTYIVSDYKDLLIGYYKYLSWVYGVDRKICHEGHWSASRGLPRDADQWSRMTGFSIHTRHPWQILFLAYLLIYHIWLLK